MKRANVTAGCLDNRFLDRFCRWSPARRSADSCTIASGARYRRPRFNQRTVTGKGQMVTAAMQDGVLKNLAASSLSLPHTRLAPVR